MSSGGSEYSHPDPQVRFEAGIARLKREIAAKNGRVHELVAYARSRGLDANYVMVAKHLTWFESWHTGTLKTGYLMNRTGVKYIGTTNGKEGS